MANKSLLHRDVGAISLMMTGIGSIIGSGWLFGAAKAARLAGPDAVYAWIIGAVVILIIALSYAELGAMFPESGGMVRFGLYTHGSLVGALAAWAAWISVVSVIPVEAFASVQYMASWPWSWAQPWAPSLFHNGTVSGTGLAIGAVLVIIYFLLNFWSVNFFAKTNTAITTFKLIIPAFTGLSLIAAGFHHENFSVGIHGGAHSTDLAAVLTAVATSGIVFSFNGFQSPVNLAGESKNPGRDVPIGVIGSILICACIYILLQIAFLGSVSPADIVNGWSGINFSSPYAQLALAVNLNFLALLLYVDAFISPSGTGTTYTASSSRMLWGMEKNGTLWKIFGQVHPKYGIPRPAMWLNLAVAFLFFFWFQGWDTGADVTSVACVISYLMGPVAVVVLRRIAPEIKRPLTVPGLQWLGAAAFMLGTLVLYWARWPLTGKVIGVMMAGAVLWFYFEAQGGWHDFKRQMKAAWWLVLYLPTIALLSWGGSSQFGGQNFIPFGWDLGVVALVGLGFYWWGIRSGWKTVHLEAAMAETIH
ncbi:MAG TPA: APC family permease [Gammaproteobacteria bacterium]|nr:APC family permease [Gammaproteobacteria bacterium]